MWLSLSHFALLGIVTCLTLKLIFRLFFHPLRHVPGPFIAKMTSLWSTYLDLSGGRCEKIRDLHIQYGPTLRVAPDELSFAAMQDYMVVYAQGTPFMKGAVYDTLGHSQHPGLFEVRDPQVHKERRKLLSSSLSKNKILETESLMIPKITRLLSWIDRSSGSPMNVLNWTRMVALDIAGAVFLGDDEMGGLATGNPPTFIKNLDAFLGLSGLKWRASWIVVLFGWVPIPRWRAFVTSSDQKYAFGDAAYRRYLKRPGLLAEQNDPVQRLIQGDKTIKPLTDGQVSSEITGLLTEATEPVGITLTFALWELARHPEWQQRLRRDIKGAGIEFDNGVLQYTEIEKLESLEATLLESLRLHPSAPGPLPRIVPNEGAILGGFQIPAGISVSSQVFTFHRDPKIFPSPNVYNPSRWLSPAGGNPAMRKAYRPWSSGSRMCIGIHMATMEMKLILAALVDRYEITIPQDMLANDSAGKTDLFAFMPNVRHVSLIFHKTTVH